MFEPEKGSREEGEGNTRKRESTSGKEGAMSQSFTFFAAKRCHFTFIKVNIRIRHPDWLRFLLAL